MEKNSRNSKPAGVCNRIFRVFKGQPKRPNPERFPKTDLSSVMKQDRTGNNIDTAKLAPKVGFAVAPDPNMAHAGPKHGKREKKSKDTANDDKFSDFITRAKMKIRTTSSIGGGGTAKRPARADTINVKAMDYINQARARIRASSMSFGNGIKGLGSK